MSAKRSTKAADTPRKPLARDAGPLDEDTLAAALMAARPIGKTDAALYIFGDGGCLYLKDPETKKTLRSGAGGWGTVILLVERDEPPLVVLLSGAAEDTTNNRMELYALIRGLTAVSDLAELADDPIPVHAVSDSQYAVKGMTEWLGGWLRRDWEGVKNVTYWKLLIAARGSLKVTWHHCRGHRDPSHFPTRSWDRFTALGNDAADRLATQARDAMLASTQDTLMQSKEPA